MKNVTVTAENFSLVRESLKGGESVNVNNVIVLTSFIANTEKINPNGKKTRTPFYYVSEEGKKYTSTTLKELLGIEQETKSKREETTFAKVWEQAKGLAQAASSEELKEAAKFLQEAAKEAAKREEAERASKAAAAAEAIKSLGLSKADLKKMLGL